MRSKLKLGKRTLICLLVLGSFPMISNGQNYTVNTTAMGVVDVGNVSGSLDQMMILARNYANTGGTATVNLAVGSLVPVGIPLPLLNHTAGKVIITSGATLTEGVEQTGWFGTQAFYIECEGDVEIRGITIKDYTTAIRIDDINGGLSQNSTILIEKNIFDNNLNGVQGTLTGAGVENYDIDIINNDFFGVGFTSGEAIKFFLGVNIWTGAFTGLNINVQLNDIQDFDGAIRLYNDETTINNLTDVSFKANTVTSCRDGFYAQRSKSDWVIRDNIFSNINRAISLGDYDLQNPSSFTYEHNFITGVENDNNAISNIVPSIVVGGDTYLGYSYFLAGIDEADLIDLDNTEGTIALPVTHDGSVVSNCLISLPNPGISCGGPLPEAILSNTFVIDANSANINGGDLTVDYDLTGANPALGAQRVEFFLANDDGTLLEYLGEEIIGAFPGPYSKTFSGVSLIGNRIALTSTPVSGLDNTSCVKTVPISGLPNLCENCINSFQPAPGKKYWVSAWVKVDHQNPILSYDNVSLQLNYLGVSTSSDNFTPTGNIIDGWQRIVGFFIVPTGTNYLAVELGGHPTLDTYFDDIRIHPFNASMKSYVYDGETFWLTSELDDNNYATFYEYDEEGGLIRIKKETERGIVTIQETRSNNVKK